MLWALAEVFCSCSIQEHRPHAALRAFSQWEILNPLHLFSVTTQYRPSLEWWAISDLNLHWDCYPGWEKGVSVLCWRPHQNKEESQQTCSRGVQGKLKIRLTAEKDHHSSIYVKVQRNSLRLHGLFQLAMNHAALFHRFWQNPGLEMDSSDDWLVTVSDSLAPHEWNPWEVLCPKLWCYRWKSLTSLSKSTDLHFHFHLHHCFPSQEDATPQLWATWVLRWKGITPDRLIHFSAAHCSLQRHSRGLITVHIYLCWL